MFDIEHYEKGAKFKGGKILPENGENVENKMWEKKKTENYPNVTLTRNFKYHVLISSVTFKNKIKK